jgi:hypothetical protein
MATIRQRGDQWLVILLILPEYSVSMLEWVMHLVSLLLVKLPPA